MSNSPARKPMVVFRLSHMGDVALTTGVLSHWNETRCDTFVFITRAGNVPLLENHPAITRIIALEDNDLKTGSWLRKARAIAKEYADHTLIDLHSTLRSRILSFFWRGEIHRYHKFSIERRLYDRTHKDKYKAILEATNVTQRYAMAYDENPPQQGQLVPRIYLKQEEKARAAERLDGLKSDKPLVALHPYATHSSKEWARQHWTALIELLDNAGMDWIIIGRDIEPVFSDDDRDFTNTTNLRDTCALLAKADLLITGDSGPMHLAGGVDTPVLTMFGPTVKAWGFFPAGQHDRVLERDLPCRPCSLHGGKGCDKMVECLSGITPNEVLQNAQQLIASIRG